MKKSFWVVLILAVFLIVASVSVLFIKDNDSGFLSSEQYPTSPPIGGTLKLTDRGWEKTYPSGEGYGGVKKVTYDDRLDRYTFEYQDGVTQVVLRSSGESYFE